MQTKKHRNTQKNIFVPVLFLKSRNKIHNKLIYKRLIDCMIKFSRFSPDAPCGLILYLYVHRSAELAPVTPNFSNVTTKVTFLLEYPSCSFRFLFNTVCFQLVVQRSASDAEQFSSQRTVTFRLFQRTDYLLLFHFHVLQGQ